MNKRYLTSLSGIANYLCRTITDFGYFVRPNRSDMSESIYLNINLSSREAPVAMHVRISNHPASRRKTNIRFDYDICAAHSRKGATTYIKFLAKFAGEHNKTLPREIQALQPGTPEYREYAIAMQKRAAS